jgi:uracil phosphoribosyltransferase
MGRAGSVREALDDLRVERIGHGVRAIEDPALVDRLAEGACAGGLPGLEHRAGPLPGLATHPVAGCADAGVKVTLSTDDPPFFHTTMAANTTALAGPSAGTEADFRRHQPRRRSRRLLRRGHPRPPDRTPGGPMTEHLTVVDHPLVQHKLTLMRDKTTSTAEVPPASARDQPCFWPTRSRANAELTTRGSRRRCARWTRRCSPGEAGAGVDPAGGQRAAGRDPGTDPLGAGGVHRALPRRETLQPVQYYCKVPSELDERLVIVVDPMLATGNSSAAAVDLLKKAGARNIRFLCLLAAPEGVKRMKEAHPDVPIVTAALDERLNEHGYIVPGLGDAGDRMFGTK